VADDVIMPAAERPAAEHALVLELARRRLALLVADGTAVRWMVGACDHRYPSRSRHAPDRGTWPTGGAESAITATRGCGSAWATPPTTTRTANATPTASVPAEDWSRVVGIEETPTG
jgi:hypothetical protein